MKFILKGIAALFCAMLFAILILVIFGYENTAYWCKRTFLMPQMSMLTAGLAGAVLICGICKFIFHKAKRAAPRWILFFLWTVFLGIELVLSFHAYFITGWDVRGIVETAYAVAGGEADMHIGYLSQYPNNVSLVLLFSSIIRGVRLLLGNPGLDRCIYVLIAFQCVLNTLTGFLLHLVASRRSNSKCLPWCVSFVYMLFIGLSPWLMIPYSDSVALIFPTAAFALYQMKDDDCFGKWVWPGMGILIGLGYMIKPQVMIVAIAIVIVESIRCLFEQKAVDWLKKAGCMAAIAVLLAGPGMQLMIKTAPIELRPGRSMNMLHYVMMGLNSETNGSYLYDDVALTYHAEDKVARQLPVIRERLENMGVEGFAEHLKKKMLTNYADGTFAWSCEGEFYKEWIADKDQYLSPFLKSIIYTGGSRYPVYQTAAQSVWLAILMGALLFGIRSLIVKEKDWDESAILLLCIIGITLFQTIFEARARYLYIYAPFYVLLGMSGIWQTMQFAFSRLSMRAKE